MREIKFRAWGQVDKKMYLVAFPSWNGVVTGKVDFINHEVVEIEQDGDDVPILMQFTGLKDRNGREIYEGDILFGHANRIYVVEWNADKAWWILKGKEVPVSHLWYAASPEMYNAEVIGNIYEHPELLEAK